MKATFELTKQQQALVDFTIYGKGNALVNAVAGSGKTSTLLMMLKSLTGMVAFAAYGTKIAEEIQMKVDAIKWELTCRTFVSTFHSFGWRAWRRMHPKCFLPKKGDPSKIDRMMDGGRYTGRTWKTEGGEVVPVALRSFVSKAYQLARQWGAGILPEFPFSRAEMWLNLVEHFDLRDEFEDADGNLPPNVDELVKTSVNWTVKMLKAGIDAAPFIFDFEDMIYMPLRYGIAITQYDWVLVDECQDLNPTRRAFAKRMMKFGGRAVFVGDPRQAIYGFTGADAKSFENIRHEFGCGDYPLTWSFRCPKAVVRRAKTWVDHIESAPWAAEGSDRTIDAVDLFAENLTADDAIICRNNAPLAQLFFALLRKGIASHIEGHEIADGLIMMVNKYPKVKSADVLKQRLENFKERTIARAAARGKEEKAGLVADMVDAIITVIENMPGASVYEVRSRIISMFQDTKTGELAKTLTLTSSHKSKGREWPRVFWYGRNRWNPSSYARQDWQMVQEDNLCYVTVTRSMDQLIEVIVPAAIKR